MEVIIKNGSELKFASIPDNELELVRGNNEEVITTITLSQEDKIKLGKGCRLNPDMTITETELYLEINNREGKEQKAIDINSIATLSDQLNLIAGVLDTLTSETPDQTIIANAKAKFNEIKTILNK